MTLTLLVVGRGGNGKSSTANSILGKKLFTPKSVSTNDRCDIISAQSDVDGKSVMITEVSGLEYLSLDNPEFVKQTFEDIEKALRTNKDGFSAVLIVIKYGVRFTKQEQEAINLIKSTFGSSVVKNYGVIVMTYGDSFDLDMEEDGQSFQDWCKAQTGDIQELFAECKNRVVLFNNRAKEKETLEKQRGNLFSFLNDIQSKIHELYTVNNYIDQVAVPSRNKILVQSKLHKLEAETRAIMKDIGESLDNANEEDFAVPDNQITLRDLLKKFDSQKQHLEEEDMKTGVLNQLLTEMSVTEMRIKTKIKLAEHKIQAEKSDWVYISTEGMEYSYEQFYTMMDISAFLVEKVRHDFYDSENSAQDEGVILSEENSTILVEIRKTSLENDDKQATEPCNQGLYINQTDNLQDIKVTFTKIDTSHKFKNTVFIFLKYGFEFTKNEMHYVMQKIQSSIGSNKDKNKSILILTYENIDVLKVEGTLEDWCKKQTGMYQVLLNECKNQCLLFNTSRKEEEVDHNKDMVSRATFLDMVYSFVQYCTARCWHYINTFTVAGKITDSELPTNITTSEQRSIQYDSDHDRASGYKKEMDETESVNSGDMVMNNCKDNHFAKN